MAKQLKKHRTGYLYKRGTDGKQLPAKSKNPGTFYLQYMVGGKLFRQSLGTSNHDEAEAKRQKIMAPFQVADEVEALSTVKQKLESAQTKLEELDKAMNPPLAISDSWQAYLDSPTRPDSGESTLQQYKFQYDRFKSWTENRHPAITLLCEVTSEIAEEYASTLNNGNYTGNTYNKHIAFLKLFFRVLGDKAQIDRNPWEGIVRKKERPASRRELTIEELYKVLDTAQGELVLLLGIGTFTGMRLGDCATLRWSEVDLHRQIINRIPNKTARSKGKAVVIGIPKVLLERLQAISRKERGEYVLPDIARLYENARDRLTNRIQEHFESCGIRTQKDGTGQGTGKRAVVEVGFHSLRHTYVSLHAERGTPAAVLQENIGHSNPSMTQHYTHISELAAKQYAAVLPAALGIETEDKTDPSEVLNSIKETINKLNAKNWKQIKADVANILAATRINR